MTEESGESSRNYYVYAHIAELGMLAFTGYYFYRKCNALEERIAKLESIRVSEVQEMDPKSVEALTEHVYGKVMETIARAQQHAASAGAVVPRRERPSRTEPPVTTGGDGTSTVAEPVAEFSEYKGSDRDELDRELEAEL